MKGIWKPRIITPDEWEIENHKCGSVYFIRDIISGMIKIGHSRNPIVRMATLQVGNASQLRFMAVMAAPREFETLLHKKFDEGHQRGEWFHDNDALSLFLHDVTHGRPLCQIVWIYLAATPELIAEDAARRAANEPDFDPGEARWDLVVR